MTGAERAVRILTDIDISIGAITATSPPSGRAAQAFRIDGAQAAYLDAPALEIIATENKA